MNTCQSDLLHSSAIFNEPDILSTPSEAIAQVNKAFSTLDFIISSVLEPVFTLESTLNLKPAPTLAIMYIKADLQRLLKIYTSAKKALQEP